jgi:hypothetical protein
MRKPLPAVAAVIAFIDRINHTDIDGLIDLMTDDHTLSILDEPPVSGLERLRRAWQGYFDAFPDYVIYPRRIVEDGARVALLGHTTGSHLGLPDEQEALEDVIWTAEARDGRLSRWSIVEDTPQVRQRLGLR